MNSKICEIKHDKYTWIDICDPKKDELLQISQTYNLNYLFLIDSLEPGHLPKIEKLPDYEFFLLRVYTASEEENISTVGELSNKISFFLSKNNLITIHRASFDFLENIDKNLNTVYELLISIIGKIVQSYVSPSEWHSKEIDEVEKTFFLKRQSKVLLEDLYFQKSETRISKKLLLLTQNVLHQINVPNENLTAFQDVKDKLINLILVYEEALEDVNNLMNTYLSVSAQKNNDVMRLLTIFSVFFLPLTFIAGIYGMNFKYLPELKFHYGYYAVLVFMAIVCIAIFIWFKKKKIM